MKEHYDKDRSWINSRKADWQSQVKLAREAQEREHADELTVAYMMGAHSKLRTLTDEVIAELWYKNGTYYHHFARAIERWLKGKQ